MTEVQRRAKAALRAKHDEPLEFWLELIRDLLKESVAFQRRQAEEL